MPPLGQIGLIALYEYRELERVKWYYGILAYPPAPNFQKCSFLLEIHTMKIDIQTR